MPAPALPIDALLPDVLASLAHHPRLVLEAATGAGKTTRVPPALLDAPWLQGRRILMLEPRRVAARAAAVFMARERGEDVGATIGYRVRFESRISAGTRIEVLTEGILTRLLQDNPELPGVGAIVFDEFHERHLHGDLGAALALDVQGGLRPDLRLVFMSATLDGARLARWLDAPRLASAGRSFPVGIVHPPARRGEAFPEPGWPAHLARSVALALAENPGDVLVFLPGRAEIERAAQALHTLDADGVDLVPLHGELDLAAQQAALAPAAGRRRVVLATNIAESSLTLPGVRAVVDLGLAREPRLDPNTGFTRLEAVAISQASADQRAGRAGRLGPGRCYRMWPGNRRLDAERRPEIAQAELSQLALELAAWGSDALPWLDPPPAGALAQARGLLQRLGALDAGHGLTGVGRAMLTAGTQPRLAAMLVHAAAAERALAADLAALVEARNPLRGADARSDDIRLRLAALHAWRARRSGHGGDPRRLAEIDRAARALHRGPREPDPDSGGDRAGNLLAEAFPDRIAFQDPAQPLRYTLSNGRGARLAEDSALHGEPWLVVVALRPGARDSLIQAAAPCDPAWLEARFPGRWQAGRSVAWNHETRAVEAFEDTRFDAIVVARRRVPARPGDTLPALLAGIRDLGLDALPWDAGSRSLRARLEFLAHAMPGLGLPDSSADALLATLEDWLAPYLHGLRRLDAFQPATLAEALRARLDHGQQQALEREAPRRLRVPSGLERPIDYGGDAGPVLAVKLQELFGLADTPRIAAGRVPLTLHLLSPGGRPVQVTRDLESFWNQTYPDVRRELKGRYPRHPWPEDPWTAPATHRARPRR